MKNITKIDRRIAGYLSDKTLSAVRESMRDSGLEIDRGSGSYSDTEYTIKIKFCTPLDVNKVSKQYTQEDVNYGLAGRGTKIYVEGSEAVIKSVRRTKYAFNFVNKPEKTYIIKFASCKICNEGNK